MTDERPLETLDSDLAKLLQVEADFPDVSEPLKARAWAGVAAAVPVGAAAGAAVHSALQAQATVAASQASKSLLVVAKGKAAAVLVATFLAGSATAILVDRTLLRQPTTQARSTDVDRQQPVLPEVVTQVDVPIAPQVDEPRTESIALPTTDESQARREHVDDSSERDQERVLIDAARTALSRGAAADARATLARHARQFPRGSMREERDALTVIATARLGNMEEAQRLADAFRASYPRSLLRPTVDRIVPSSAPF